MGQESILRPSIEFVKLLGIKMIPAFKNSSDQHVLF